MKSYELAYQRFLAACEKWAEESYRFQDGEYLVSKVIEGKSDDQAAYGRRNEARSEAEKMIHRYVYERIGHEKKYGKGK